LSALAEYAYATLVDDFAAFCAEHCTQSIDVWDGDPLILEPWEFEIMEEALAVNEAAIYHWGSIVIVLPRKNGKTTLLAAYALYSLLMADGQPEILLCASSDKQAGRLFQAVISFIRRDPWLSSRCLIREWLGEVSRADGGGKILRMSSSPETLHGYNPSLVICDEVAQWVAPSLRRAWAALTTAGGARQLTQVFTISTAGQAHEREEGILGRLIDGNERMGEVTHHGSALTISRNHDARTIVFNHCAPTTDRDDISAIKAANPASWITEDYLRRQSRNPELTDAEFLQLHGCVWSVAEDIWIKPHEWDAIESEDPLLRGDTIALGFDGSRFLDSTVLMACRLRDGLLCRLAHWSRPAGAAGKGWEIPAEEVHLAIADAFSRYRVVRFYPDPPYWQTEVQAWSHEYGDKVVIPWPTNRMRQMSAAVERMRTDALAAEGICHDGDSTLRMHVLSAHMRKTRTGYWIEKASSNSPDKIDAAVAAVLAYEARNDALDAGLDRRRSKVPVSL
jgi:phage terminase large subunit-like protein